MRGDVPEIEGPVRQVRCGHATIDVVELRAGKGTLLDAETAAAGLARGGLFRTGQPEERLLVPSSQFQQRVVAKIYALQDLGGDALRNLLSDPKREEAEPAKPMRLVSAAWTLRGMVRRGVACTSSPDSLDGCLDAIKAIALDRVRRLPASWDLFAGVYYPLPQDCTVIQPMTVLCRDNSSVRWRDTAGEIAELLADRLGRGVTAKLGGSIEERRAPCAVGRVSTECSLFVHRTPTGGLMYTLAGRAIVRGHDVAASCNYRTSELPNACKSIIERR